MSENIKLALMNRRACPQCDSLQIIRRVRIGGYRCGNCGWRGNETNSVKIAIRQDPPTTPGRRGSHVNRKCAVGLACHERVSSDRISRIKQLKDENPTASVRTLAMLAYDSEYAVRKALKDYDPEEQLNST